MKKNLLTLTFLGFTYFANAQVGIGTNTPQATLDIKEKRTSNVNDISAHDGVLIPKVTKAELALKDTNAYTSIQNGAIIYVPNIGGAITGPSLAQVANVDAIGFYYLDSSTSTIVWRKLDTNTNLYNVNGTLTETRIVTQNGNTLMFTDGIARDITSKTNSIIFGQTSATDANPTMVLASGARKVGINTKSPRVSFDINGALSATSAAAEGLLIPKMTASELSKKELNTYKARCNHSNNTGQGSLEGTLVYIFPDSDNNFIISPTDPSYTKVKEVTKEGLYYYGIDDKWHPVSSTSTNFYTANGTLTGPRVVTQGTNTLAFTGTTTNAFSVDGTTFSVDAAKDRVGIGTTSPNASLDVTKSTINQASTVDGIRPPNMTRVELANKTGTTYGTAQTGTIVYVYDVSGVTTGTSSSQITYIKAPGFYNFDGTTWQPIAGSVPIIEGTMASSGPSIAKATTNTRTGHKIALPSGKWRVSINILLENSGCGSGAYSWNKFSFTDTTTGTLSSTADLRGATQVSGPFYSGGTNNSWNSSTNYTMVSGDLVIENSTATAKNYELFFVQMFSNTAFNSNCTFSNVGNSSSAENNMTAMRIQ